jgi:lipopolysaccharide cholinephosphotransferase
MYLDINKNKELKERYNPEGSILRKAQLRMVEMLSFIDSVCRENNIEYWLDSGTLLGAVRHGGFIPWDDDTDICMTREHYKKFKHYMLTKNKDKRYALQCHETDPNYFGTWGVLRDMKSELSDKGKRLENFKYRGLQIDIFLIDDRCNKILWKLSRQFFAYFINAPLFEGRFTKYIRWNVPYAYYFMNKFILPLFHKLTPSSRNNLYFAFGMFWYHKFSKEDIYPLTRIIFENKSFPIPCNTELYLTEEYGDWKTIPPEEKRQTHNFDIKFL